MGSTGRREGCSGRRPRLPCRPAGRALLGPEEAPEALSWEGPWSRREELGSCWGEGGEVRAGLAGKAGRGGTGGAPGTVGHAHGLLLLPPPTCPGPRTRPSTSCCTPGTSRATNRWWRGRGRAGGGSREGLRPRVGMRVRGWGVVLQQLLPTTSDLRPPPSALPSGRYYADIREAVPASDQEMNSLLAELSRVRLALAPPLVKTRPPPPRACLLCGSADKARRPGCWVQPRAPFS